MNRIFAIAENTFKEALRQKLFLLLVFFSILLVVTSIFLGPFALGETPKIIRDVGLGATAFFSILVVIVIGSGLIHRDVEKRTIYTVITRPIKRNEIIIGKFFGLLLLIIMLACGMTIIQQLLILLWEGSLDLKLLLALPFTILETMVLLGILLFFSAFSSSTMTTIMAIIFYVIGHASPALVLFAEQTKISILKYAAYIIYYLCPNLENFNFRLELVHSLPLHSDQILFALSYGFIYTIFLIYITSIVFQAREFK